jgi:hypothetical protein
MEVFFKNYMSEGIIIKKEFCPFFQLNIFFKVLVSEGRKKPR